MIDREGLKIDVLIYRAINMTKTQYVPRDNHMKIRVREPDDELWLPITKTKGKYRVSTSNDPEYSLFRVLDIGKSIAETRKARGIWFIRGVPSSGNGLEPGDFIESKDWKTQSVRVEYSSIKSSSDDSSKTKTTKLKKSKYWKMIKNFLSKEYNEEIKRMSIKEKEGDFRLVLSFYSGKEKSPDVELKENVKKYVGKMQIELDVGDEIDGYKLRSFARYSLPVLSIFVKNHSEIFPSKIKKVDNGNSFLVVIRPSKHFPKSELKFAKIYKKKNDELLGKYKKK